MKTVMFLLIQLKINPFGINDYLGNIKLTPHRAKYWSETKRARVVGNIRGELNSYESDASSYDNNGRRLGFGTVYRDWEIFWCGIEERERDIVENTPNNRVQDTHENRSGDEYDYTAQFLLSKYLSGQRIELESLDFSDIRCPHTEIDILKGLK